MSFSYEIMPLYDILLASFPFYIHIRIEPSILYSDVLASLSGFAHHVGTRLRHVFLRRFPKLRPEHQIFKTSNLKHQGTNIMASTFFNNKARAAAAAATSNSSKQKPTDPKEERLQPWVEK